MLKRGLLALVSAVTLGASVAPAQVFGQPSIGRPDVGRPPTGGGPAISPYLNLNRGGLPAVNYYGLVRPQLETAQSLQLLQTQLGTGLYQPGLAVLPANGLITGHRSAFFNTSHYYPKRYPVVGPVRR